VYWIEGMSTFKVETEDEDDGLGCIGSMFDSCHTRSVKKVKLNHGVHFDLKFIDMEPGHVISGQYLWPAAEALGNFLVDNWNTYRAANILELGAGCGLAGIAVAGLEGTKKVIFTDNDPGALGLIQDNLSINSIADKGLVYSLAWGAAIPADIRSALTVPESLLLIGSDLIYCKGVVKPLLTTARDLFNIAGIERTVGFVLCFSFDTGEVRTAHMRKITIMTYLLLALSTGR
jgi:predicted nicotinamide N-methyase